MVPKITMEPTDIAFRFRRLQFPVKLSFAMSINKAQGQTLKVEGLKLENPCFSHGQLYVGCSRTTAKENLFVISQNIKIKNIVYDQVLE